MKKILVFPAGVVLGILFCFLFLRYCCKKDDRSTEACILRNCTTNDGRPPADMIDYNLARDMSDAYNRDSCKSLVSGTFGKKEDATSIWFELKKLKTFISFIEQAVCKNGCDDSLRLGVRIYYAKYPANTGTASAHTSLRGLPREYANMHTLFFAPIYFNRLDSAWKDFDPRVVRPGCKILPLDTVKMELFMPVIGTAVDQDPMNHGGLRPPPYGRDEVFPVEQ